MNNDLNRIKNHALSLAMIIIPVTFIIVFAMHPDLLSFELRINAKIWAEEFRGNNLLHTMHVMVIFLVPALIYLAIGFAGLLAGRCPILITVGTSLAVIGAVFLAVNKGALCLTISAFDTLNDVDFNSLLPGLQSLVDFKGYMWIVNLILFMPIGFIILSIGLIKEKKIERWRGNVLIISMLFMINPDIDLLSLIGSILMFISIGTWGMRRLFMA